MIKCYNGGKLGLQEDECSVIEFGNKTIAVVDTAAYKISAVTSLLDDETLKREIIEEMCRINKYEFPSEVSKLDNLSRDMFSRIYRIARINIKLRDDLGAGEEKLFKRFTADKSSDEKFHDNANRFKGTLFENESGIRICIYSNNNRSSISHNKIKAEMFDALVCCIWTDDDQEPPYEEKDYDEDQRWYYYEIEDLKQKMQKQTELGNEETGFQIPFGEDKPCSLSEVCNKLKSLIEENGENEVAEAEEPPFDSAQKIYYGPPGTGKTRKAKIEALKIVTGKNEKELCENDDLSIFKENKDKANDIGIDKDQIQIVQFHPSYSYNEFMETIDARGINKDGVFKKIANDARNHPDKKYVLIIDEINRANVSEVLGELLYGIEYRGQKITTGISNDDFSVPENLYIIGTMNTADRSLQALDYAVRRRFTFKKVKAELPDPKPPEQKEDVKDKGCYEIENGHFFCQNVFKKVQEDVMKSVARGIDPEDIMPGISYFLVNGKNKKTESDPDSYDEDHLKYKMEYELIPLLREYAKNGMFTKRKKLDINEKSLVELLYDNTYFEYLENNLSESEKK